MQLASPPFTEKRILASQLLAHVVEKLFPNVGLMGGGLHSLGYYYDFSFKQSLTKEMIELIEVHLHRFVMEGHLIRFITMMRENAQTLLEHYGYHYLADLAGEHDSNVIDLIQIDQFYGLSPSLSLASTEDAGYLRILESFELVKEWGKEEILVTRIIGTSQNSAKDLKVFCKKYDYYLKNCDHRVLGPKLKLFQLVDPFEVVWLPKGVQLQHLLLEWLKKQLSNEELQISTPLVARRDFFGINETLSPFIYDSEEFCLRASLTQQHIEFVNLFSSDFNEIPFYLSERSSVYKQCPEMERWGLLCRSSYFSQQTTICCFKNQVHDELISSLHLIEQIITMFGFKAQWFLMVSRQKSLKSKQDHEAIKWFEKVLDTHLLNFPVSSEFHEEGREKGVWLELRLHDKIGRDWPVSRVSLVQPPVVKDGQEYVLVMRQVWESLDRFIALLIEQCEGVLPAWIAPEQVRIVAIGEDNQSYAKEISKQLKDKGVRVQADIRLLKLSLKIHEAEKENIPYIVLVGEQERVKKTISLRTAKGNKQNRTIELDVFLNKIDQELLSPKLLGPCQG